MQAGDSQSSNFAGIISASNVSFLHEMFDLEYWMIDSRALDHIASNKDLFNDMRELKQLVSVELPDGNTGVVKKIGVVDISPNIRLLNVLHLPEFQHNVLSLSKLIEHKKLR